MAKEKEKLWGYTDEAAQEDLFDISNYISGMSDFIVSCKTPMTISIQGSWGTGKTSVMNMIRNNIEKKVDKVVWFNTWQFSQFNMDDELAVSLLKYLIDEFKIDSPESKAIKKGLTWLGKGAKEATLLAVDKFTFGQATTDVSKIFDAVSQVFDSNDPVKILNDIKGQFKTCVNKIIGDNPNGRIVIFIDDLDRLEPRKAVEMLEVLKNFLDCTGCVFVLAIDYEVVVRGVASKYGKLGDDKKTEEQKGKSFFDKIIQVPFKMPISSYNITRYVQNCMKDIGFDFSEAEITTYVGLIETSIGTNPRTMKRLFNAFLLLTNIVTKDKLDDASKPLLFATLCLQHFNEDLYNYIVVNRSSIDASTLQAIANGNIDELEDLDISTEELAEVSGFMNNFLDTIDSDNERGIDDDEWNKFIDILDFSTITSAATSESGRKKVDIVDSDDLLLNEYSNCKGTAEMFMSIVEDLFAKHNREYIKAAKSSGHIDYYINYKTGKKRLMFAAYLRKKPFISIDVATLNSNNDYDMISEKLTDKSIFKKYATTNSIMNYIFYETGNKDELMFVLDTCLSEFDNM